MFIYMYIYMYMYIHLFIFIYRLNDTIVSGVRGKVRL